MKNIYLLVLGLFAFLCASCDDNRMNGMVNDKVYIVQSGEQEVFVNARDFADFVLTIYKSGIGTKAADVTLSVDEQYLEDFNTQNGTNLQLLEEYCYEISKNQFSFSSSDVEKFSTITFDGALIKRNQELGVRKFALPLKIDVAGGVDTDYQSSHVLIVPILE